MFIKYLSNILVGLSILVFGATAAAQTARTEHTYKLDDPDKRVAASIEDVAWMAGNWRGTAFGDRFEEVWNPPSAGTMVGFFKLFDKGEIVFYELLLLVEEEGSLSLKVKHFNADFTAWEEKGDYVRFRLVKLEPEAVHFSGLSFHRKGPDEIEAFLAMRHDGELREERLTYQRVKD